MKVLILGAPRTGTTSIGEALQKLGYNVHKGLGHSFNVRNHLPELTAAIQAKSSGKGRKYTKADYDRFIGCYDAAHGVGVAALADELLKAYPEAKVILTPRDIDSWLESWNASIMAFHQRTLTWRWIWLIAGGVERDFQLFRETAFWSWSNGHPFEPEEQRSFYLEYNQHIRDVVTKGRLLEMRPEEGWQPLCQFLGEPVPDGPFPHATSRAALNKALEGMWEKVWKRALVRIGVVLGCCVVALALLSRFGAN